MSVIKIAKYMKNCLSETNGIIIREKVQEELEKSNEVTLDFSNINLFATPFFNAFIGYLVINIGPTDTKCKIKMSNISELGNETYLHSFKNAKRVYEQKINTEMIGKITEDTIKNA